MLCSASWKSALLRMNESSWARSGGSVRHEFLSWWLDLLHLQHRNHGRVIAPRLVRSQINSVECLLAIHLHTEPIGLRALPQSHSNSRHFQLSIRRLTLTHSSGLQDCIGFTCP